MEPNRDSHRAPEPALHLSGDLDFRSAPEVKEALLQAVAVNSQGLTVDMTSVGFVDSTGLSALFEAAKLARHNESRIRLVGVQRNIRRLLSVCGFSQFFDLEPATEPACIAHRPSAPGVAAPGRC